MTSICEIYGKHPSFGKYVSYSRVRTSRRWNSNIQHVRAFVNGVRKCVNICTSCLKAGKIERAPRR